jgi:hypothetical protein
LGGEQARNLGTNVNRSRQMLMITAAVITAGAVSVSGPIGFVGLVIPHSVRMLIGPDHCTLLPFSALGGGIFLLICDTVGRTRLEAAASADFVIVIYNPRSIGRPDHIHRAKDIIMKHRVPDTPVGIVKSAMRDKEKVVVTNLKDMLEHHIDMQTTLIIGNSQTFSFDRYMITPRGYEV